MNPTLLVQIVFAGLLAVGQLTAGVVLVMAGDPQAKSFGYGLLIGAGGTTAAAFMPAVGRWRQRRRDARLWLELGREDDGGRAAGPRR